MIFLSTEKSLFQEQCGNWRFLKFIVDKIFILSLSSIIEFSPCPPHAK